MKLKTLTAAMLSLCLLASSSAAFAAHAAAASGLQPAHPAHDSNSGSLAIATPAPAGTKGAQHLTKNHQHRNTLLWVGGVALAVVIIGTSGGKSSSGATGTTAP